MATATKKWSFLTDLEGLTAVPGTDTTMARDGANGNPSGSGKTLTTTRNQAADNFWYLDTTWEGLGVPAGGVITHVRLNGSYYYMGLTDWNVVDLVRYGPYQIRTQDDITTIATMLAVSGDITAADSAWQTIGVQSDQAVNATYEASDTAIRVRFANYIQLGNDAAAAASVHEDEFEIVVTYTPVTSFTYFPILPNPMINPLLRM